MKTFAPGFQVMTHDRVLVIRKALTDRCTLDGNWLLRTPQRWWLTAKFIICFLLGREHSAKYYEHSVVVAITDSSKYPCEWGECYNWFEWCVGKGVIHNWWFCAEWNGAP